MLSLAGWEKVNTCDLIYDATFVETSVTRGVARGGGAEPPSPELGQSVNPIQTWGADYAPHITASPPGIKKLSTTLVTFLELFDMLL